MNRSKSRSVIISHACFSFLKRKSFVLRIIIKSKENNVEVHYNISTLKYILTAEKGQKSLFNGNNFLF
jgi:hypothetical protein